jgi:glycosyltransferase involved in cell wall biosynthesis
VPVITTPNAGSVVRDEIDGFIVPIRDSARMAECLLRLSGNRDLLLALSFNALQRARDFTWERYSERLVSMLCDEKPNARLAGRPEPVLAAKGH